jgi:hypothetical protein
MANYKAYAITSNGDYVLVTLADNGVVDYYHTYSDREQLAADIEAIKSGDVPARDWDGNADNNAWGLTAQELYNQIADADDVELLDV